MREIQGDLPGAVRHFAAVNDRYHAGTRSKHASGLAFDTSLTDPRKSLEAAEAIRDRLRKAGLREDQFRVMDEYRTASARSTGGGTSIRSSTLLKLRTSTPRPRPSSSRPTSPRRVGGKRGPAATPKPWRAPRPRAFRTRYRLRSSVASKPVPVWVSK
jgi:hypothetical protein